MWRLMLLIGALLFAGCSSAEDSSNADTVDNEPSKPKSEKASPGDLKKARNQILSQLPEAAGMKNADFQILAMSQSLPRLTGFEDQSFSLLVFNLSLDPINLDAAYKDLEKEFQYLNRDNPRPSDIADAIRASASKGYASFLQPEGLSDFTCQLDGSKARGAVSFRLKDLIQGRVHYVAEKTNGDWKITEFHLPTWEARTVLKAGTWKASGIGVFPKVDFPRPRANFLLKRADELHRVPVYLGLERDKFGKSSDVKIVYQNQFISKEDLGKRFKALIQSKAAQDKPPAVIVHADRKLPVSHIRDVLKLAHEAGFQEARLTARGGGDSIDGFWGELPISLPNPPHKQDESEPLAFHAKLIADPDGSLKNLLVQNGQSLGSGPVSFARLNDMIKRMVGHSQTGKGQSSDPVVEIDADPTLDYQTLIQAVSSCEFTALKNANGEITPYQIVKSIRLFGIGSLLEEIEPLELTEPIPLEELPLSVPNVKGEPRPLEGIDLGLTNPKIEPKPLPIGDQPKVPKGAVAKGSFTVWTVPKDPKPGEQYNIMIQIQLPKTNKLTRIPKSDVKGHIVGTDGYKDYFGGPAEKGFILVKKGKVLLDPIPVPGAQKLVKDIITVESKLLKEKQTLEIVF